LYQINTASDTKPRHSRFRIVRKQDPDWLLNVYDWLRDIASFPFRLLIRLACLPAVVLQAMSKQVPAQKAHVSPKPAPKKNLSPIPLTFHQTPGRQTFQPRILDLRSHNQASKLHFNPPPARAIYPGNLNASNLAKIPRGGQVAQIQSKQPTGRARQTQTGIIPTKIVSLSRLFRNRTFAGAGIAAGLIILILGNIFYQTTLRTYRSVYAEALTAQDHLALAEQAIRDQKFDLAKEEFLKAQDSLLIALDGINANKTVGKIPGISSRVTAGENIIQSGLCIAEGGYMLTAALEPVIDIFKASDSSQFEAGASMADYTQQIMTVLAITRPQLKQAYDKFETAKQYIANTDTSLLDADSRSQLEQGQKKIDELQSILGQVYDLANVLPEILGHYGARHYILVFENNAELRPTGGFIGTYGVVTFSEGKLDNYFTDNVYNPDGQIAEQDLCVLPPKPLQRLAGCWGMRDANWSPDFPTSAAQIMHFYEQGTGRSSDGVIAITPEVIEDLLSLTGPIYLQKWDEVITSENAIDTIQYKVNIEHVDADDPKLFLIDLSQAVLDRLLTLKKDQWAQAFAILGKSLAEKNILLYFTNDGAQQLADKNKWSGTINETNLDYLHINNANISATKASQYLKQRYRLQTDLRTDGTVENKLTITYEHTGTYEWPSGHLVNYQRIYLPLGSSLIEATNTSSVEGKLSITEVYEELGKTVFADYILIAPGSTINLSYTYILPFRVAIDTNLVYALDVQKQPGTKDIALERQITYDPFILDPLQAHGDLEFKERGLIEGITLLLNDANQKVVFTPHTIL